MLGIGLGLLSSIAWGISDYLGGQQARRVPALVVLLISQPVGLALAVALALSTGADEISAADAALVAGAGGFAVLGLGAFYRAMAIGSVSVVATLGELGLVVPVAVGLAQGESPSALQAGGAGLAVLGAILVVQERGASHPTSRLSIGLALIAAVGFGTFFVGIDATSGPNPFWALTFARLGGVAVMLAGLAVTRPSLAIPRDVMPILLVIGFFDILANCFFAVATNHGLLSLVAVAGSLYAVVTVTLARLFLGERLGPLRLAGFLLVIAGAVLIAAG